MDPESAIRHVHGPEEVMYGLDELVVVCLVRDGRPYLKSFVEHYFSLGVKHVVFLDNGSSDGTISAVRSYENVTVLQTELPFKEYKIPLRQYLVTRFGRGRWILYVDIDELFDYPYSGVVGLSSLLGYLTEKSYTAVVGQMLDMFPEESVLDAAAGQDEPLKEFHKFYDISNITTENYHPAGSASNTVASDEIEVYRDGINRTLFGHNNLLTKHPLIFIDDEISPMENSSVHWVGGARVADITCVLFHYKFIGSFHERAVRAVEEESYASNSRKYKRYLETLERTPELQLKRETAQELKDVTDLVDNQFLVVSGDYIARVEAEEKKSGAAEALKGSGSRRLVESFCAASARARTQARVARNLERQVEMLEDSLVQERRRIELLERRNQNLERQIRNIQGSRSWRLLGKLARIRNRMPGKG
ncbi:MAG: glycosyltransferase family 2 protein [Rubrobacter sp.]|nr:glycosyltransferase family 2 protein [Rubrobacter sp.]